MGIATQWDSRDLLELPPPLGFMTSSCAMPLEITRYPRVPVLKPRQFLRRIYRQFAEGNSTHQSQGSKGTFFLPVIGNQETAYNKPRFLTTTQLLWPFRCIWSPRADMARSDVVFVHRQRCMIRPSLRLQLVKTHRLL